MSSTQASQPLMSQTKAPGRLPTFLYSVPEGKGSRAAYVPRGRTLHLIDIENLMDGPLSGSDAMAEAVRTYKSLVPVGVDDHVVIGMNPCLALTVEDAWPHARLVVRGGPDGADIALLDCVQDVAWTSCRYDRIVIGSGDGAFAPVVRAYRGAGLAVGVVARARSLSHLLARTASFVRLLPDLLQPMEAA